MNTRTLMLGAVIAAALNCSPANAQVLGGNVGGAVNGTLSGGMRDLGVITHGGAAGSLGADLDTGSLHRTTRDTLDRTTTRARNTAAAARKRAESTVGEASSTSANVATSAAATATQSIDTQQIGAVTNVAGSAAANATTDAAQLSGAANGSANQAALLEPGAIEPTVPNVVDESAAAASKDSSATQPGGDALGPVLSTSGNANGSASGDASASERGVSARTSGSAEGSGSASLATSR